MSKMESKIRERQVWESRQGVEWIVWSVKDEEHPIFGDKSQVALTRNRPTGNRRRDSKFVSKETLRKYYEERD